MERGVPAQLYWNDDRPEQAFRFALLGLNEEEITKAMDIPRNTLEYWKRTKPEFLQRLQDGKRDANGHVAAALYKKAIGYDYYEERAFLTKDGTIKKVKVQKHAVADTMAMTKFLALREKELWSEVQRIETKQTNINITQFDFTGFGDDELKIIRRLQLQQMTTAIGEHNN